MCWNITVAAKTFEKFHLKSNISNFLWLTVYHQKGYYKLTSTTKLTKFLLTILVQGVSKSQFKDYFALHNVYNKSYTHDSATYIQRATAEICALSSWYKCKKTNIASLCCVYNEPRLLKFINIH